MRKIVVEITLDESNKQMIRDMQYCDQVPSSLRIPMESIKGVEKVEYHDSHRYLDLVHYMLDSSVDVARKAGMNVNVTTD